MDDKTQDKPTFEQDVIRKLALAAVTEQRRSRRWKIFFAFLFFIYLFAIPFFISGDFRLGDEDEVGEAHTALVDLQGVIGPQADADADRIVAALREAFENDNTAGVILRINSPGGSPVQSSYIYKEMRRLREQHPDTPLYAVIADLGVSGGYYVAVGADKIYANESSVIGSIGVIMPGFGFEGAMRKLGIERRLLTAGEHKAILDPFSPAKKEETEYLQAILDEIHAEFITAVKTGRADRLAADDKIFSGLVWTGARAKQLGLIDDFGSAGQIAREVLKAEDIVNYTHEKDLFTRLSENIGVAIANQLWRVW